MPKLSACTSTAVLSMGCWLLVTFFCLNLPSSLLAYSIHTRGRVVNVSKCLDSSEDLMKATDAALHHLKKEFNCALDYIYTENPKNEEKIRKACMAGKSMPGSCSSGENNIVDEASCTDTMYNILNASAVEIKDFGSPDLLNAITHMMKILKPEKQITEQLLYSPQHILKESFEMDMKQCKILLTLQQLVQTIHRTFRYRMSVEM